MDNLTRLMDRKTVLVRAMTQIAQELYDIGVAVGYARKKEEIKEYETNRMG